MKWDNLERVSDAPGSGQMLAYTRTEVIFKRYSSLEEVKTAIEGKEMLELHLFDNDKEYRCVKTRSAKKYPQGIIETVVDFGIDLNDDSKYYAETVLLEANDDKHESMTVYNEVEYSETGMLYVKNYRLVMGGVCKCLEISL